MRRRLAAASAIVYETDRMGSEDEAKTKKPRRSIAALLGVVGPWGLGQFYLGQSQRAVLWLVFPSVLALFGCVGLRSLGEAFGYGLAFALVLLGIFAMWLGSLIDVLLIPEVRVRRQTRAKVIGYWVAGTVFLFVVRAGLRQLILEAWKIPSIGMEPTLLVDDHFMVDKVGQSSRKPKRGETIVFESPERRGQYLVERTIAIAGDKLELKNGHPWLNGWEVPHCFVGKASMPGAPGEVSSGELHVEFLDGEAYLSFFDEHAGMAEAQGPYAVAEGELWVVGDNRNNSHDSRFWFGGRGGGVPLDLVKGRALFRWLSFQNAAIEWSRFGTGFDTPLLPESMKALQSDLDRCLASRPAREKTLPPSPALSQGREL